jgi:nitrogen fixation/metabolism regulation signal transduction histidine kinase
MIKNKLIYNYKFLILVLLIVILLQFLYIVILKLKKKKIKSKSKKLQDLSSVITPLNHKINSLKKDKENYEKILKEVQNEIKLYSEEILNTLEIGVLITDKDKNVVYKNKWFNDNNFTYIEKVLSVTDTDEIKIDDKIFIIKKQKYDELSIFTINDITTLKKLEQEIQTKEKLAYLGEMSAFIAHEFKNSLTAIKGFAAALKRKSDNPEIVEKVSANIIEEIDYFHKILIDYLNYSKEVKLNKEAVNLKDFMKTIIDSVFAENNIKITYKTTNAFFDSDKMKQVLINLIKNSIEATESNSKSVEVLFENEDNHLKITIKDFGKGISDENMKKILNPFFTTKSTGTGLGTSIAYQIIKAHNGNLEYSRNVPQGTITKVILPQ